MARPKDLPRPEAGRAAAPRPDARLLILAGLIPLVLLAAFVVLFLRYGPLGVFEAAFPPVEKLTIDRVTLRPGEMIVAVTNGGPRGGPGRPARARARARGWCSPTSLRWASASPAWGMAGPPPIGDRWTRSD